MSMPFQSRALGTCCAPPPPCGPLPINDSITAVISSIGAYCPCVGVGAEAGPPYLTVNGSPSINGSYLLAPLYEGGIFLYNWEYIANNFFTSYLDTTGDPDCGSLALDETPPLYVDVGCDGTHLYVSAGFTSFGTDLFSATYLLGGGPLVIPNLYTSCSLGRGYPSNPFVTGGIITLEP